jgi:hydrogenase expression/formation protein HypC
MCLAIPLRIVSIADDNAIAELENVQREINLSLLSDVKVNDYVLVHVGYAIQKIDAEEAEKTLQLLKEMKDFES